MSEKKIIVVAGATGAQGGGLARAILSDPSGGFAVRALTRDVTSAKAQALAKLGAEVVQADVDDPASLVKAFDGAYGAFCVTFFWAHFSPDTEMAQARHMADAARAAGVQHVIWSTLEDTRAWLPLGSGTMPTLMGKYNVPHFDAKGAADASFDGLPVTYLLTAFYWDNLIYFGMGPKPEPDGTLVFTLPMGDAKLPGIWAEDIGRCAYGVFKAGPKYVGQRVGIMGGMPTGAEMAAGLTRALGRKVVYNAVSPEAYRGFGFPGAEDLGNMFQFKHDFEDRYCAARSLDVSRELNPSLQGFDEWAAANKGIIPIE